MKIFVAHPMTIVDPELTDAAKDIEKAFEANVVGTAPKAVLAKDDVAENVFKKKEGWNVWPKRVANDHTCIVTLSEIVGRATADAIEEALKLEKPVKLWINNELSRVTGLEMLHKDGEKGDFKAWARVITEEDEYIDSLADLSVTL